MFVFSFFLFYHAIKIQPIRTQEGQCLLELCIMRFARVALIVLATVFFWHGVKSVVM